MELVEPDPYLFPKDPDPRRTLHTINKKSRKLCGSATQIGTATFGLGYFSLDGGELSVRQRSVFQLKFSYRWCIANRKCR